MTPDDLPPVEWWWPYLTIEARHLVLDGPDARIPSRVRKEITRATGRRIPEEAQLSEEDRDFIALQIGQVE